MTKEREALKLALAALEDYKYAEARTIIREALAQPEQEPVALVVKTAPERIWLDLGFDPSEENEISYDDLIDGTTWSHDNATGYGIEYVRVDLTPPHRKPLTEKEIDQITEQLDETTIGWSTHEFARAIEAAHGIKE